MNIGIVVHRFDSSEGTGGYAVELTRRIAPDHRITVYAAEAASPVPEGVEFVRVPAPVAPTYATILGFPAAFAAVRRRHDLVHAQGWVTGRADVVTTHIVLAAWRQAARRAGVESRAGERWFGGFVARRERALVRRARHVIAPSARAARDIAVWYGRDQGVSVIHHGFPQPATARSRAEARAALGLPASGVVALYAGDPRKGLDVALAALALVDGVHLAVASRTATDEIRARAAECGIAERVTHLGFLPDMAPAYAAADLLLHPTIYDTFGLVAAEAMSCGLPVVVTREAGISELIEHRRSGWILSAGDAEGTAEALTALMRDSALREAVGNGARETAARRGWDRVVAETLAVYEQAVPAQRI